MKNRFRNRSRNRIRYRFQWTPRNYEVLRSVTRAQRAKTKEAFGL